MGGSNRGVLFGFMVVYLLSGGTGCALWSPPARLDRDGVVEPDPSTSALLATADKDILDLRRSPMGPDPIVVVHLQFDVLRVSIPATGSSYRSEEVWTYVDELRIDPATTGHLARNGIRVGVGRRGEWNALRTALTEAGARSELFQQTVQNGYPLILDLGPIDDDRPVFTFHPDGRLVGRTFSGGTKFLRVDYHVDASQRTRTALRVTFEVFKESPQRRWQMDEGGARQQREYEGHVFEDLSVEVTAGPGEFLVIGAAEAADNLFVLGQTMFRQEISGQPWETLVMLTPLPFGGAGGSVLQP